MLNLVDVLIANMSMIKKEKKNGGKTTKAKTRRSLFEINFI